MEVNPAHPIIKELFERVKDDPDKETEDLAKILYEGSLINSGYNVKDPSEFSKRFYSLFNGALGIRKDAPIENIEIDVGEESDDSKEKEQPEGPTPG